jgi:O-antigen ligase
MKSRFVQRLPFTSLLLLFPLLIFSYYPVISLGTAFGVHLDISLLYGVLLFVFITNLPSVWKQRAILTSSLAWKIGLLFVIYIWISYLWSSNPFRAFVTASFFTLVFGIFSAIIVHLPALIKQKHIIIKLTGYAFVFAGVLALWQIIVDAAHFSPAFSLLPSMYSGDTFGIARPTSFALEPQFFGSLLLIPFLYTSYRFLTRSSKLDMMLFSLSTFLLLLTLSRGALLAAIIALVILMAFLRPLWQSALKLLLAGAGSIILTLLCITLIGTMRQDTISGYATVKNVISQLTLGTISLPDEAKKTVTTTELPSSTPTPTPTSQPGYVESSTISRLSMSTEAIDIWNSSPHTQLIGVGIGGFGASLQAQHAETPDSSVVNNFYLELLAETGLIGAVLFFSFVISLIYAAVTSRQYLLLSLVIAFLVQWCFFSGTSNVVHIWVIFGLLAAVGVRSSKHGFIPKPI